MKLICAGLPKTGLTSILQALRILGYTVYDDEDHVFHYMDEWLNLQKHGKVPDFYAMYKDVDAVIDHPSNFFFEELMEAFPDAKVLLSVRDEDAWIKSFQNHNKVLTNLFLSKIKFLLPTFSKYWFITLNARMADMGHFDPESSYICRKRYRWHNDRVKSAVPADKLLVYRVKEGWEPLCEFIGKKIPDQPFPHLNVKGDGFRTLFLTDSELGKKIAGEVRRVKVCFVAVMVALIAVVLYYLFRLFAN